MGKGLLLATDFTTPLDIGETALLGDRLISIHPDWQGKNGMLCCISLWPEQDPNSEGFYEYGSIYAITSPDVLGPDTVQRFLDAAPRFDGLMTRDSLTFGLQNSDDVVALVDLNRPASDVPVGIMGLQHFDWSEKRVVSLGMNLNTIYIRPFFRGIGLGPMFAASVGNVMANKSEAWLCKNIGKFDNMNIEVVYEGITRGSVKCAEVFMDHLWSSLSPDAIDVHCILAGLKKRPTCNMELVNEY